MCDKSLRLFRSHIVYPFYLPFLVARRGSVGISALKGWPLVIGRDDNDINALPIWPKFGGGEASAALLRVFVGPL